MKALEPVGGVRRSLGFSPTVRRVDIERGRAGYGFTVVGQAPCVLSGIVKGSPAHDAGLKPGDCVVSVNGTDVSAASHEAVVELIGSSLRSLSLLVSSGDRNSGNVASSSTAFHRKLNEMWSNPGQMKSFEKDRGESVGSFNTVLEISSQACTSASKKQPKQRPRSEPDMSYWSNQALSKRNPHVPDGEEPSHVVSKDSVFSDFQSQHDILPDSSILNVGMMVGYINSTELDLLISHSEEETLQAIRECIAQIATEQKTHYLVMMRVKCNCVQLCDDRDVVLAAYPAENLLLCAVCTEDGRFFGLVSKEVTKTDPKKEQSTFMKTLCHVFIIDPELCDHDEHKSISDHFGFSCTPDPDTQGCLEFPQTPYSMLNFVSVLYTDMGDHIEKLRLKLDNEDCDEHRTRNSGSGDSGIENASPEDQESFADRWSLSSPNSSHTIWDKPSPCISQQSNGPSLRSERRCLLAEPFPEPVKPQTNPSIGEEVLVIVPINPVSQFKESQLSENKTKRRGSQRWPSVSIRARWQKPRPTSLDSLADSDTSGPKSKNSTLPPAMDQIPPLRYKTPGDLAYDLTLKLFSGGSKNKDAENKGYRFWGLTRGRSSVRQTSARTNRLSLARSLDDLETVASDGERGGMERHGFGSINSLESNSSLPNVTTHHALSDRRVAAWAVSFERLLQDPVGVRYFSEFLKKEFSEENILFWQACEYFSQVPEHDKKQLSQKAREIYNSFLSSKATTPVNIDSQAQLADDVLTAPRPDMFKQPQLQIFNLMKFDSYARFLKSSLYQECILAEVEGRPLPDPYHVPCSPAPSKHSFISERSTFSTPKKDTRKPRTGRSSDDLREDPDRRNGIFSWYRNRSFGKGPKKREITDFNYNSNGRRESQESLSSGASQEFTTPCSTLRNEKSSTWERDKTGASKSCTVALPDGSSCCVCLKQGASIRQVLLELCQKQSINMAAVDLFLVGGEKPLVLDQDSMTLSSRDLRIEKRTLFRLDLVPINRSVGLKAKPTKPVAEVLRPVVAKYGLRLNDLVARISGEIEPLDLGLPISNLDGLRVVLERSEPSASTEKSKTLPSKTLGPSLTSRGQTTQGDHKPSEKPVKGEGGDKPSISGTPHKKKGNQIHLDDAEEFFELLSRAQSSRADDQRGLLRKEDLVLPDFLRLKPEPSAPPSCSTPTSQKHVHDSSQPPSVTSNGHNPTPRVDTDTLSPPLSPILCPQAPLGQDGEGLCDLTLVGEGDISSPNSTLLPPVPTCPPPHDANFTPPPPPPSAHRNPSSGAVVESETPASHQQGEIAAQKDSPSLNLKTEVDVSPQDKSFEGYAAELRQCQSKMRNGPYSSIPPSRSLNSVSHGGQNNTTQYKATFV